MTKDELIELKALLTNFAGTVGTCRMKLRIDRMLVKVDEKIEALEDPRVSTIRCTACVDGKDMLGSVCIMCYGSGMIEYVDTAPRRL